MSAVSIAAKPVPYQPTNKVRFVTATSLFDGHDASVNIMRRVMQASGAEVIHLGHNRSAQEIVNAALQQFETLQVSGCIRIDLYRALQCLTGALELSKAVIQVVEPQQRVAVIELQAANVEQLADIFE